jgi:hypothetical protein
MYGVAWLHGAIVAARASSLLLLLLLVLVLLLSQVNELVVRLQVRSQSVTHWLVSPVAAAAVMLGSLFLGRTAWLNQR